MPTFKISPTFALVTAGQAVTFQATDDQNQPVNVTWSLTPELGSLITASPSPAQQPAQAGQPPAQAPPLQNQGSSATYVAPSVVQTAQIVAVTAKSATDTGSVTISITPDAISIIPPAVELHAMQQQKFEVIVASGSGAAEPITWILTPQVGTLSDAGLYAAPDSVPDDEALTITAVCKSLGKQVSAKVTLKPEPWRGIGVTLLAFYLFLVFWVVFLMIGLWPSEIPNIDALKTNQAQAQSNLDKSTLALQTAGTPKQSTSADTGTGTNSPDAEGTQKQAPPADTGTNTNSPSPGGTPKQSPTGDTGTNKNSPAGRTSTKPAATIKSARQDVSDQLLSQLTRDHQKAQKDADDATKSLKDATSPDLNTRLVKPINREIDFLCLVILAGALGSFLHMAQSFSDFTGNRTLKNSWVWWYCFQPFVGAGLAVVLYAALRGGLITVAATPSIKATDLNPYGLVAAAALAGLFSKAATTKLGEIFETAFQSSKGAQTKDPLNPGPQGASQPPKPGAAGNAAASKTLT